MTVEDLTLVGLTEDKTRLILVGASGQEYSLPADAKLRAALRGDHARLGQLEIQMDSALRPRDIQARIRSGESPETVAVAAKTTVDKIMAYATPVLAERAHVADRAQRASVRRKGGEGPSRLLGDSVAERLRSRNVDPATVEWDAWRREDGRWTLVADYLSGESSRHAEFCFDAPGRYVVAEDDEARWLVGEQTAVKGPQPRSGGTSRRLTSVSLEDDELPLGADAIELVAEPEDEHTVDLSEAVTGVRDAEADTAEAAEPGAGVSAEVVVESGTETSAEDADAGADGAGDDSDEAGASPSSSGTAGESAADEGADEGADEDTASETPPRRPVKKSRGRASVPSWDEIMFGGGKND